MSSRVFNKAFFTTGPVTVAYPPVTVAGDRALLYGLLKYAPAAVVEPAGWTTVERATGGSGPEGPASGSVFAGLYTRVLDGTEGGTTFQVDADSPIDCLSVCLDIYHGEGSGLEIAAVAGSDNTPGKPWMVEFADQPDLAEGDLVVLWSGSNQETGPNRTAHSMSLTVGGLGLGPVTEFRDGGWPVGDGLGGSTVEIPVQLAAPVYRHTANIAGAQCPCGVSFLIRLREVA